MKLSPSVGGVWGVLGMSLATIAVSFGLVVDDASAGGCPTTIRVPEDAASINQAAAMVCANTTAEILLGPGTWPAHILSAPQSSIVIRGSGIATCTVVPVVPDGGVIANGHWDGARIRFADLTLQGVGGGDNLRTTFTGCRVANCTGNFFPEEQPLTDTEFVDCNPGSWGVLYLQSDTTISNCSFLRCNRAILYWPGASLPADMVISDCAFTDCLNHCIWIRDGDGSADTFPMRIINCTFQNTEGRGIYAELSAPTLGPINELFVESCSFIDSTLSSGNGAAIHLGGATAEYTAAAISTTLTNCTFTNNSALSGGAVNAKKHQPLTLTNCTFTGNTAEATAGTGGAISHEGPLTAASCVFTGNTAGAGGAHASRVTADLVGCTFSNNHAIYGGASYTEGCVLTISESSFIANTASNYYWESGGAIETNGGTATITGSQFVGNHANGSGGAIAALNPSANGWWKPVRIADCSFVNNGAAFYGGGVYFHGNGIQGATISGCRFEGNTAPTGSAVMTYGLEFQLGIADCDIVSAGTGSTLFAQQPGSVPGGLVVGTTIICGIPSVPMWGATDAGGNCFVASCADSDNNGTPDACQIVTVPGDYASVQLAIDSTPAGEYRIVSVGAGTFAGPISFGGRSVVVRGAGAGQTIIEGTGGATTSVVGFTGGEPASAALEGVTIRGGTTGTPFPWLPSALAGGGVMSFNSAASLRNCVVELNDAGFGGGAYFWQSTGAIENCIFRGNGASSDGGGIQIYGGSVAVVDTLIESNEANGRGGGIHLVEGTPSLTRTTVRTNFSNNVAAGVSWVPGGDEAAYLAVVDSDVTGNTAAKRYGGVAIVPNGATAASLSGTVVCDNTPWPNISGPWESLGGNEVCICVGDIIVDGAVNAVDLSSLLGAWGTSGLPTGAPDVNHDGIVDGFDLGSLLGSWGSCSP